MPIERNCLVCGTAFPTYPSKIKLGKGKYCSKPCSNSVTLIKPGQHLSPETQIKLGEPLPEHIHLPQKGKRPANYIDGKQSTLYRQMVKKEQCAWCKSKTDLVIHHKNCDHYDNGLSNLEVLCASCHNSYHKKLWWKRKKAKGGDANACTKHISA